MGSLNSYMCIVDVQMWIEMSCVIIASFCELEIYYIHTTFFTVFKD